MQKKRNRFLSYFLNISLLIILIVFAYVFSQKYIYYKGLDNQRLEYQKNILNISSVMARDFLINDDIIRLEEFFVKIKKLYKVEGIKVYKEIHELISLDFSQNVNPLQNIKKLQNTLPENRTLLHNRIRLNNQNESAHIFMLFKKQEFDSTGKYYYPLMLFSIILMLLFIYLTFIQPVIKLRQTLVDAETDDDYSIRLPENKPYFSSLFTIINNLLENIQFRRVERDSAEGELKLSKEKLARIIETIPQPIYWKDKDSVYIGANHHFKNLLQLDSIKDIIGKTDDDLPWSESDLLKIKQIDLENKSNKSYFTAEEEFSLGRKHSKWLEITQAPLLDNNSNFIGILGIIRDISEQVVYKQEIEDINRELENVIARRTNELADAYKELETFSYSVSHDLRAPLRKIQGFSEALAEDAAKRLNEQDNFFLSRINSSCSKMFSLIESMIELAKVSAEGLKLQHCDLSEMILEITDELKKSSPDRHFTIKIQEDVFIKCDQKLMRIAMTNILRNAFKFTRENDHTLISFKKINKDINNPIYIISDNGTGFDNNKSAQIFTAFTRLHPDMKYEGSGIGLATVKRIINRHKGKIWAESEVGQGCSFYFTVNSP